MLVADPDYVLALYPYPYTRVATWQVDDAVARARYFMVPEHEDMHERFREILRV